MSRISLVGVNGVYDSEIELKYCINLFCISVIDQKLVFNNVISPLASLIYVIFKTNVLIQEEIC